MDGNQVVAVINGPGDVAPDGIASLCITFGAASIAVAMRFLSRRLDSLLGWDDWLILTAWFCSLAVFGVEIYAYSSGAGKYIGVVTPHKLADRLFIVFFVELFWCLTIFLVRASALALWHRIFVKQWVARFCYAWMALNAIWVIGAVTTTCTQCVPIRLIFHPLEAKEGQCNSIKVPYIALGSTSILLDAVVLILPMILVWQLQMNRILKLMVCAMFLTGLLTIIITIIRLIVLNDSDLSGDALLNIPWVYAVVGYWTVAELNIAIFSACLPVLRPLLHRIVPRSWIPECLSPYIGRRDTIGAQSHGNFPHTSGTQPSAISSAERSVGGALSGGSLAKLKRQTSRSAAFENSPYLSIDDVDADSRSKEGDEEGGRAGTHTTTTTSHDTQTHSRPWSFLSGLQRHSQDRRASRETHELQANGASGAKHSQNDSASAA